MKPFKKILDMKNTFFTVLRNLSELINQTPDKGQKVHTPESSLLQKPPFWARFKSNRPVKDPQRGKQKEVYGPKGSGYKGKGSVNTSATIFNHPRKDFHAPS